MLIVLYSGQYFLAPVLVPANQPTTQLPNTHFITTQQQQQQQPTPTFIQQNNNNLPAAEQQQQQGRAFVFRANVNARQITSIWLTLKLAVVLFMICQGASIEEIFIYHIIAFIFFLYQTGRLRVVIRRIRPNLEQPRPEQQATESAGTNEDAQTNHIEPTLWNTFKRGLVTFVASLWPNYGRDPRIAQAFEN